MKRYDFTPNQIFNMDETGVQTVLNILPKHVALTGKKADPKTVAAEQGQTVTATCASPVGRFIPPFFIYSRKRENRLQNQRRSFRMWYGCNRQRIYEHPYFIKWLKHFQKYAKPGGTNPILLIPDNHISPISFVIVWKKSVVQPRLVRSKENQENEVLGESLASRRTSRTK